MNDEYKNSAMCVFSTKLQIYHFLHQPCMITYDADFFQTAYFVCIYFGAEYALGSRIAVVH